MDLPAPPLPASNGSRPRQMVLAEAATTPRGWDNGVGGYQTNSMLETRIGSNQDGKICNLQYLRLASCITLQKMHLQKGSVALLEF